MFAKIRTNQGTKAHFRNLNTAPCRKEFFNNRVNEKTPMDLSMGAFRELVVD